MKKKLLGLTAITVTIVVVGVLFVLGYAYGGIKAPAQRVAVYYHVCSDDMINQYNGISADTAESDRKVLSDIATRIKSTKHNEEDPTCQAMLFFAAFRTEDYQGMRHPMQLIQGMHDKGIYADTNLSTGYSVRAMDSLLKEVISDTQSS